MTCKGRVAIVTGSAGKGMGRSIALTLAREGASVVVNYRASRDSAEEIVRHIQQTGREAIAVRADVFDASGCRKLVDAAVERFGRVDVCVVGPGSGWHPEGPGALDSEGALDDVRREVAPLFHLMPLVLPGMYERGWGQLVAIAMLPPYSSPAYAYNAAKAARAQALMLARDEAWRNGVTVNVVGPGPVPEIATLAEAIEQCSHGPAWTSRKSASPQDVAEGVAFLCSEAGRFVSGCELPYLFRG
jgi:3-oxoacyl-[acyl-carrier protein] reductase